LNKEQKKERDVLRAENQHLREKSVELLRDRSRLIQRSMSPYQRVDDSYDQPQHEEESRYRFSRNKSQNIIKDPYSISHQISQASTAKELRKSRGEEGPNWQHSQDLMNGQEKANMRSKSQDKVVSRGQEHLNNERVASESRHSIALEMNKRELVDKDRMIESKNKEIVRLRMENDELKQELELSQGGVASNITES
jgi:hypothetical protein